MKTFSSSSRPVCIYPEFYLILSPMVFHQNQSKMRKPCNPKQPVHGEKMIRKCISGMILLLFVNLFAFADEDRTPVYNEIQKQHAQSVERFQKWIRQPSIAAENKGMNDGCELMMQMLRD